MGNIKQALDLISAKLQFGSQLLFEMMYHRLLSGSDGNSTLYQIGTIDLGSRRQGHIVLRRC
jgi:hypothetical protein